MKSAIYICAIYLHKILNMLPPEQLALLAYLISGGVSF